MGKFLALLILASALIAGGGMYYLQVHHFYEEVEPEPGRAVEMTSLVTGEVEPVLYDDFRAIDADSSPIRYRACFTTTMSHAMLTETYEPYDGAVPLTAPAWFDCFDAEALGAALESGEALAFLGERDVLYGIDRVVAIHEDGRGFAWHQINRCGEVVFDGQPAPEGCPEPPGGY
ncbi:histidine kinase [Roseovarius sp. SCSIO 43702]|uniref:DUF6446 family protein n=1 Tax=Roseovarius sp. SCSIO 43702 TaxID=2823043 RepID=UPI001C72E863|nr:DUF6446 family protein [Roseovarius sp. SCSIO 43702]QYX57606.1 histidine kinase [Roseovarius sp. SCSIO 43702]